MMAERAPFSRALQGLDLRFWRALLLLVGCLACVSPKVMAYSFEVTTAPSTRQILLWPFADYSIWNLPVGANANYAPANMYLTSTTQVQPDPDVLLLNNANPMKNLTFSSAAWTGASRCNSSSPVRVVQTAPFPPDFIVPDDGNNYSGAILMPDNFTIYQNQPICHCNPGTSTDVTTFVKFPSVNITTDGRLGAHGGSSLSSIGGTLRLGELIPDALGIVHPVRHALKSELWAVKNYWRGNSSTCYRWPAANCDGYFADGSSDQYNGTNPLLGPGSLLALAPSINISNMGLTTVPGRALAWTLQNYGTYLCDDTYWNAISITTELSPDGNYKDQFYTAYGLAFNSNWNAWAVDVRLIFSQLSIITNWDASLWNIVMASGGTMGAGGGAPMQPWAPPFSTAAAPSGPVVSPTAPAAPVAPTTSPSSTPTAPNVPQASPAAPSASVVPTSSPPPSGPSDTPSAAPSSLHSLLLALLSVAFLSLAVL